MSPSTRVGGNSPRRVRTQDRADEQALEAFEAQSREGSDDRPLPSEAYADMTVNELDALLSSRGIELEEGTGRSGMVVKSDRIKALEENDVRTPGTDADNGDDLSAPDNT